LTSKKTGEANAITVSFESADPSGTVAEFDFDNPVQAASNASISLGSGAGAIEVTSDKNQLDEVIPGVTIKLLKADTESEISIDITRDTEKAKSGITDFVNAFNDFISYVNEQSRFDPESGASSVLFGNRSVATIKDEITRQITSPIPGVDGKNNRLSAIGISINENGLLQISDSKLTQALSEGNTGLDSLSKLFGLGGETSHPAVRFVLAGSETVPSVVDKDRKLVPYNLRITDAAEKARIIGTNSLQASTTIDASNNELTIKLDSTTEATVNLAEGVYTPQELADHLETVILNSKDLGGRKLSASVQDGKLELTSNTYGNTSTISIVRGSAVATLGLTDGQSDSGLNVIGEFVFNPGDDDEEYIEKAEGRGQVLIGRAKSEIAGQDPVFGATE
jgi:flagellar hook-associated protein 2